MQKSILDVRKVKQENNLNENRHLAHFYFINQTSMYKSTPSSCKINENGNNIFEVKVLASSREQAKNIVDNWKNNAESYYPKILDLLLNKGNEKMDE